MIKIINNNDWSNPWRTGISENLYLTDNPVGREHWHLTHSRYVIRLNLASRCVIIASLTCPCDISQCAIDVESIFKLHAVSRYGYLLYMVFIRLFLSGDTQDSSDTIKNKHILENQVRRFSRPVKRLDFPGCVLIVSDESKI